MLLVGCALPSFLLEHSSSNNNNNNSSVFINLLVSTAGVITIGVGDSFASIIGRQFGRHKWKTSGSKTIEGSAAFLVSTFTSWLFIAYFSIGTVSFADSTTCLLVSIWCTLMEALAKDNDNLILPCATMAICRVICAIGW
jgi:dolichol kinase